MDEAEGAGFDRRLQETTEQRDEARRHLTDIHARWRRVRRLVAAGQAVRTENHIAERLRIAYGLEEEKDR